MSSPRRDSSPVWPGGPSLQGPHRVGSFALCPQQEAFAHELHLRPVLDKLPTAVGTLVHAGLAYRYAAMLRDKPEWYVYENGYQAIRALAKQEDYCDLALRIFEAYERHYSVNVWTPVLVEHQFVVHFENGEPYSARTDLLVWWNERRAYYIVDHKSVGKFKDNLGLKYATDRQMLTNLAIARASGYPVAGVIINALSREMPYPNFGRFEVPINDEIYNRLGRDTHFYLDQMKAVRKMYPDPMDRPRNTEACLSKVYGMCDFYGLCTGTDGLHSFHVPDEYKQGRLAKGT